MKVVTTIEWDCKSLAESMGISPDALIEWSADGRNLNKLAQIRIRSELGLSTRKIKGGAKILVDKDESEHVVRCLSSKGVSFSRSFMKGHGRGYDQDAWQKWILKLDGFLVPNICEFPSVDVFRIPYDEVYDYFEGGDRKPDLTFKEFQEFSGLYLEKMSDNLLPKDQPWEEAG